MRKTDLRKLYKEKRNTLVASQVDELSLQLANKLLNLPIWEHTYYHLFLSIEEQNEVQTDYILHILHAKDKEIVVSKSDFTTCEMTNYLLTDTTKIRKNNYNIPEPLDGIEVPHNKIDVVFIPLLAFDSLGNRVGYGKGFYDRMLEKCSPKTLKIGLSLFEATPIIEDVTTNDVTLNFCVTPQKIYSF